MSTVQTAENVEASSVPTSKVGVRAATPFKIDKLGNVTDRETGQFCGYVITLDCGTPAAVFSHITTPDGPDSEEATAWDQFIAEVGRAPHIESDFRTRTEAAKFLWDTRDYDRTTFPPAPFQAPYQPEGRTCWVASPNVRGEWDRVRSAKPQFTKLDSGWAVHGRAADLRPGETVEVRKRSGEVSTVELEDVVETTTVFGVEMVTAMVKKTPPKPRGAGNRRTTRTTVRRSRRECPVCGEERGSGLFNGWNCHECGWRA